MKYKFLKQVGDQVNFVGKYMEIYIPKILFEKNIAEFAGDRIKTFGAFDFIYYPEGKGSKIKGEFHSFSLAADIIFEFDEYHTITTKLRNNMKEETYNVFELSEGSMFLDSLLKERNAESTKKFIAMLHSANLPSSLPYEEITNLYLESSDLHSVKLNNPSVILEMIVAELCRYNENLEIPFREIIGKNPEKVSPFDYQAINVKKLPALKSTFNALTFEDINQSIISSVKKTRNNESEDTSPVEQIIKY